MEHASTKHREPPSARSRSTARRTMSRYRPARKIATDFHRGISFRLFYDLIIVPHLLFMSKGYLRGAGGRQYGTGPHTVLLHRTGCRYRLVQSCASTKSHLVAVRFVGLTIEFSVYFWSGLVLDLPTTSSHATEVLFTSHSSSPCCPAIPPDFLGAVPPAKCLAPPKIDDFSSSLASRR